MAASTQQIRAFGVLAALAAAAGAAWVVFVYSPARDMDEADTYARAGNDTEAIVRYTRVLKSGTGKNVKYAAHLRRGALLLKKKDYAGYLADVGAAAELDPIGRNYLLLGNARIMVADRVLFESGASGLGLEGTLDQQWGQAQNDLDRAVTLDPSLKAEAEQSRERIPEKQRRGR